MDGERSVENVSPISELDLMAAHISRHLGRPVDFQEKTNISGGRATPLLTLVQSVGRHTKAVLPADFYTRVKYRTMNALSRETPVKKLEIFNSPEIRSFVDEFHADDAALLQAAQAEVAAHRAALKVPA